MAEARAADPDSRFRPATTLAAALVAVLVIVPLGQHGLAFAGRMPALAVLGPAAEEALFTFLLFGALLAVAMVGLRFDGRPAGAALAGPAPLPMASVGTGIGLFGLLTATGYAGLAAMLHPGGGHTAGGAAAMTIGTLVILFQSAVEEIYFRGWLQPALIRAWGQAAGLLVAAAAFAALHIAGGARGPLTLVNLFLGGVLFGLLALRSRGLAAPVAAHFAWNWAEQILLGLDPNPGVGSFGAVYDLDLVGSAWWGGSDEGLNASIAISFVLVALIVPVAVWRGRPAA